MTDTMDTVTEQAPAEPKPEQPAPALISADAFETFRLLLAVIGDERTCKARFRELRELTAAASKVQAALAAERVEWQQTKARELAAIDERKAKLDERTRAVLARETHQNHREQALKDRADFLDRREGRLVVHPNGLTQSFAPGETEQTSLSKYLQDRAARNAVADVVPDPWYAPSQTATLTRTPEIATRRAPRRGRQSEL
jgi:hypothetical protein